LVSEEVKQGRGKNERGQNAHSQLWFSLPFVMATSSPFIWTLELAIIVDS
jgi:hypothetical protein